MEKNKITNIKEYYCKTESENEWLKRIKETVHVVYYLGHFNELYEKRKK